ncbi:winged helix-turn-helix transcriptional regulator [Larkinella insperata]|uniref:Winged helix-turn-helix transcriptional regulator n=1 Tax=Larkinella insperata TaxID=332158 RepID=A0ABW3QB67_9BACT
MATPPQETTRETLLTSAQLQQSVHRLLSKWRLSVVQVLRASPLYFGDIRRRLPTISEMILAKELKTLVRLGVLERKVYRQAPRRVEYRLSQKGQQVLPLVDALIGLGSQFS